MLYANYFKFPWIYICVCTIILKLIIDAQEGVEILVGLVREPFGKKKLFIEFLPTTTHFKPKMLPFHLSQIEKSGFASEMFYILLPFNQIRSIVNSKVHEVYNSNKFIIDDFQCAL